MVDDDMVETGAIVDFDRDGRALGVEFLWVSAGLDLRGGPRRAAVASLLEANGFRILDR